MLQQAHAPIGGLRQIAGRGVTVIGTSRRRPWLTRALLALTLLTAISAFHGGGSLVADPSGGLIQLSGEWLRLTPFSSYLIPGLLLSLVVGGSNLIAAVALLRRHPYAPWIAGAAGCALTGWMAVQILMLGLVFTLQTICLAVGLLIAGLSLALLLLQRAR